MPKDVYSDAVQTFQQEVTSKNSQTRQTTRSVANDYDVPVSDDSGVGRIQFTEEYRFMLHRHWSLFDSMYYSRYVSSRLRIWSHGGAEKLHTFLAQMGVSIKDAKQQFRYMPFALKERLRLKIKDYAADYKLDEVIYGSFTTTRGFQTPISSADMAVALLGLLECGSSTQFGSGEGLDSTETFGEDSTANFVAALDALSPGADDLVQRGLEVAMHLQRPSCGRKEADTRWAVQVCLSRHHD